MTNLTGFSLVENMDESSNELTILICAKNKQGMDKVFQGLVGMLLRISVGLCP